MMIRPTPTRPPTRPPTPPASRPAPAPALPEGLLRPLLGKRVAIRLLFGDEVEGVLSRVDKFELLVTLPDGSAVVVLKGGVSTVREAPQG
jgi:hypothetical protein